MGQYLARIPRIKRFRFVQIKGLGSNKGQNKENFDKFQKSFHEPLAGMY